MKTNFQCLLHNYAYIATMFIIEQDRDNNSLQCVCVCEGCSVCVCEV